MLACVCVWEVLGRGGSQAEEDLVHTRVGKKVCKEAWKRLCRPYCTGMLQVRRLLAQWQSGEHGLVSYCFLSGGYGSSRVQRSCVQPLPSFPPCPRSVQEVGCSAGSASPLLQGEKRSSGLLPSTVSVTACAWVNMAMWTPSSPLRAFHASRLPPSHHQYIVGTPRFECHPSQIG